MSHSYRFDRFELRLDERQLYVDGLPAALGARAVDVLVALVERQGRLVSKHELMELVWPGMVVEENNVQVQVSSLRKVLGSSLIATVPGRGYRFSSVAQRQVVTPMLQDDERALRPPAALSVLPAMASPLWGRERDLSAIQDPRHCQALTTVVGAGGIGKTAFALAVAHAWRAGHRDGAVWVELAGLSDPDLVVSTVAQALKLPSGGQDPLATLVAALAPLQLLLVLDNAEHVLPAVAALARGVLAGAPQVRLLVTSQAALQVQGERVFRLGALSVPAPEASVEEAMLHGAVALLVNQAQALDRRFALTEANVGTAVALCRRLDGVPLAIKLAASRMPLLGLQGVWARLDQRFKLLTGHDGQAPARQQTLLATLDWSHDLLSAPERAVFRRLSVFAASFTLTQACAVAQDDAIDEWTVVDALSTLVDRSMAMVDGGDLPRYRLPESTREYAVLKLLQEGEHGALRRRHADVMSQQMASAYDAYWCERDDLWLQDWGDDVDNVRAALDWAQAHDPALGVALCGSASVLFMLLGLAPEARRRSQAMEPQALALSWDSGVARYWLERSRLHWGISNVQMHDFALRACELSRAADDERGVYLALRCLVGSGLVPPADAARALQEMARLEQPQWPVRLCLQRLLAETVALRGAQRLTEARQAAESLLMRAQSAGLEGVASAALSELASINLALGDHQEVDRHCDHLLTRARVRRDNFVVHAMALLACSSFKRGDAVQAREALRGFVAASRGRDWEWLGLYAVLLALLAAEEGRHEAAARLLGYTDRAYQPLGTMEGQALEVRTRVASLIHKSLDDDSIHRLVTEGALMDAETVCAWALDEPQR